MFDCLIKLALASFFAFAFNDNVGPLLCLIFEDYNIRMYIGDTMGNREFDFDLFPRIPIVLDVLP